MLLMEFITFSKVMHNELITIKISNLVSYLLGQRGTWHLAMIYDEAFCENSSRFLAVNYFRTKRQTLVCNVSFQLLYGSILIMQNPVFVFIMYWRQRCI